MNDQSPVRTETIAQRLGGWLAGLTIAATCAALYDVLARR